MKLIKAMTPATPRRRSLMKRPFFPTQSLSKMTSLAIIAALTGIFVFTAHAHNWFPAKMGTDAGKAQLVAARVIVQNEASQETEVELITVTSSGFAPGEITRPRAPFILALHNQSGEAPLSVTIKNGVGEEVTQVQIVASKRSAHQTLDLPAGQYTLSVAEHPDWHCIITLTD